MKGKEYKGPKKNCTYCGKNLLPGEIISVSKTGETFCQGSCVTLHERKIRKEVSVEAMMYIGG